MAASTSSVVLRRGISASSWLRREIETASATAGGHEGVFRDPGIAAMNSFKSVRSKIYYERAVLGLQEFVAQGREGGWKLWKNLTFFVGLPAVGVCMVNAYLGHVEHAHHGRPEFVKYDHMRLRGKKYPWGDGNHSFFHTSACALPDGYED